MVAYENEVKPPIHNTTLIKKHFAHNNMATIHTYICPDCGYKVHTNPAGYDALMSGMFFNFRCGHCKEIVSIHASSLNGYWVDCPKCGKRVTSNWNPIDGGCPKCGSKMKDTGDIIMAD